jgi:1-acyl-sn-glycerol-3-phosphate acyltransferase
VNFIIIIYRWIVGFAFFFLIATLLFFGLIFFEARELVVLVRPLCRALLRGVGVRIRITGLDNFDHQKSYIIVCNHESLLDAFICPGYIPLFFVVVEMEEHFKWPVWGWMTRRWGNIPINRDNLRAALSSLKQAQQVLVTGTSVLIFPEGGRTVTGEMGEFKKGAFHLARQNRADILPVAIRGLYRAKTRDDWRIRSANVVFNFGKPLCYQDYKNLSINQLRDLVRQIITDLKQEK